MALTAFTGIEEILNAAPVGILVLNNEGDILWHNQSLEDLLNINAEQIAGKNRKDLKSELHGILIDPPETIFLQKGHQQKWLRCTRQSTDNQQKILFYTDISQEQQLRFERDQLTEDLQQLTTRDPITGLPNRRALLQALEPLISRSRRYSNPLSLIKLNVHLDGNDHDGAIQEDSWIKVGQMLKDQMRWADVIGRYDGADFLLILPETPGDAAQQLAAKVCDLVKGLTVDSNTGSQLKIDCFCGIASWDKGDDAALMLQRASDNLASAKAGGTSIAA